MQDDTPLRPSALQQKYPCYSASPLLTDKANTSHHIPMGNQADISQGSNRLQNLMMLNQNSVYYALPEDSLDK